MPVICGDMSIGISLNRKMISSENLLENFLRELKPKSAGFQQSMLFWMGQLL
jgi:hypothetical protein